MRSATRLAAVGAAIGLGAGLAVCSPAAAITTPVLVVSDITELTPGQSISTTVTDVSGILCDRSFGIGEWNVYLAWYRAGLGTPVAYSVAQSSQPGAFVAGASTVISTDFFVVWLEHDPTLPDLSSWDGMYSAVAGCMTPGFGVGDIAGGDGVNHTGTPTLPVDVTYMPITLTSGNVGQGESFGITVKDASQRWCNFTSGAGFSMGAWFDAQTSGAIDFTLPGYLPLGRVPGVGNFTWANFAASVTVTIPKDTPPGQYRLGATCVGPAPAYLQGDRSVVFGTVTVTKVGPDPTPPLPNTGYSSGASASAGFIALAAVMFGSGALLIVARRRRLGV